MWTRINWLFTHLLAKNPQNTTCRFNAAFTWNEAVIKGQEQDDKILWGLQKTAAKVADTAVGS